MSFDKWYEERGEDYNEARRKRYEEDPKHRERVLAWNAKSRQRKRKERLKEQKRRRNSLFASSESPPWRSVQVEGVGTAYTVGALSRLIGRSVQTLRGWEAKGIIPETPYRDSAQGRVYTGEQLNDILEKLSELGIEPKELSGRSVTKVALYRVRLSSGKEVRQRLYGVSMLEDIMERSRSTLLRLEREGFFPETPLRTENRRQRRYSGAMLRAVGEAWERAKFACRGAEQWEAFRKDVENAWRKLGIEGASIIGSAW